MPEIVAPERDNLNFVAAAGAKLDPSSERRRDRSVGESVNRLTTLPGRDQW